MKKNKILRTLLVAAVALVTLFAVTTAAAEYAAGDGMTFEIVTSKQEYDVNEEIQILLLAKNYNTNMKLANISWDATIPGGELTLLAGEATGTRTVEVGERAVINYRLMKIVDPPEEPQDPESTTPSTQPEETPSDTNEGEGVPGGQIAVLIILIVLALAGIGGIVFLILKRRGVISCIALVLSLGMLLPCIPAVDVSAAGLNIGDMIMGDDNVLNASVKFIVDGKEYEATATMTYEMADQTETVVEAMYSSMSNLTWEEFAAPLVTPTVGEHPRLRFVQEDIPRIVKTLESEECAGLANEFFRLLGMTFNGVLSEPEKTVDDDGNVTYLKTNYSTDKVFSIRAKALYYALYKDSEDSKKAHMAQYYGKIAVRACKKLAETVRFPPMDGGQNTYYLGYCQMTLAEVYDWCYDLLTYEDKQYLADRAQWLGALNEAGWPVELGSLAGTVTGHHGGPLIQQYWMAVAIAMYDEYPSMYEVIAGWWFEMFPSSRNAWNVAGIHHQGASYGAGGRHDSDLICQLDLYSMTGGDNDRDGDGKADGYVAMNPESFRSISYGLLYSLRPDGQFLREGDTWEENQTNKGTLWSENADHFARAGSFYKDGILLRVSRELSNLAFDTRDFIEVLTVFDPEVETKKYSDLPYTQYFDIPSGSMTARTGWDMGIDSNDVIARMQLTSVFATIHQHRDAGHFQIYYKGILASDSGMYTGTVRLPHHQYYVTTSIAHNTLTITSPQNRYGTQVTASDPDWGVDGINRVVNSVLGHEFGPNIYKPEYSYLAGDIAASYRTATDTNAQEAVRSMLFLNLELDGNTEHPGAFVVFDQIKTSLVGSKKSFLLHMQSEPEVDGNTIVIKNTEGDYNGMLTNQVLYVGTATQKDDAYTITKIGGPSKEFVVGNYNYALSGTFESTLCEESGWGRVEISTTTTVEEQTDYMLNVMYVGDADGDATVIPAKLIYDGKGVVMGAQLMNHVAMFNMDGNHRISSDVSFTIPQNEGYSTFKVNVAGLQAGTWTVYVDGKSVGTQIASEEGGMIYFEAAAGTVKLVRSGSESNKTFDETPIVEEEPIGIMINNFYYYTDAHPVKSGEDYLFPVTVIFDALNGKGSWNKDKTAYTVRYKGVVYVITANSLTANGESVAFNEIRAAAGDLLMDSTTLMKLVEGSMYYDRFINRIRVTVNIDNNVPLLSDEILYKFPTAAQVEAVIDNGYSTLPVIQALDGDITTRWTSQKSGNNICEAIFDFGKTIQLTDVVLYFWGDESAYSNYIFDLLVSTDGVNWETVYDKAQSGEVGRYTWLNTYLTLPMSEEARYVKFVGHGRYRYMTSGKQNSTIDNGWSIVTEIIFLQKAVIDPNGAEVIGQTLLAEAECFNKEDTVKVEQDNNASGREVVISNVGYTTNPGTVDAAKPQLSATFIPRRTAVHYIWAKVNASKVTSGDTIWVNIDGVTGNTYYPEKINVGKKDKDGYVWIKLGQYEDQTALAKWTSGEAYTLSVISGCEGLVFDCFIVSPDASYVPYEACYSKKTSTSGIVSVNAKDTIYEHSMAKASGNDARLQSVSADGTVSEAYKDYVLSTKNLPGDLSLNILTDTSGIYSIYATVKVSSLSNDQFFYAISANDDDFKYTLCDLSEVAAVSANQYVKIKLGEVNIQAAESIYVRIKTCSKGVTFGSFTTTCELPQGVFKTSGGKITVQAEEAKLQPAGEETVILDATDLNSYYKGEVAAVVESAGAAGGKAVRFMRQHSAWNQLANATSEATPHLSFQVMPDEGGEYYIWVKLYAPKGTFIYAWIDGGDDYYFWQQPLTMETYSADEEDYIWVRLYQEYTSMAAGLHKEHSYHWKARRVYTIGLRGMSVGVKVDEILITNDPKDAPHNHSYSSTWNGNDTHHWFDATCGCQNVAPRAYAEHFFEDHTDKECNTCGYKNPNYAPHNYADGKCTICGGLAPFTISGGKLTLEAENLMLAPDGKENHIPDYTGAVVKVVESAEAEGGKAVQFVRTNSGWNTFPDQGTTPIPHLSVLVTPERTGRYYIWLKVYAPANASYGAYIYAYVDGGSDTYYWRQPLALNGYSKGEGDYIWVCLNQEWKQNTEKFADHTYNWTAGQTYALRFRGTVAGVRVDQIYITNSASDVPHNHTWNSLKSYDDTYHWWTSSCHTGMITGKAKHNYDNLKDTTCNDCNYVRPEHVCTFSERWSVNSTQHWHQCACGEKTNVGSHSFANGYCSVCNMMEPLKLTNGRGTLQGEHAAVAAPGMENVISDYTDAPATVKTNAAASGGATLHFNRNHTDYAKLFNNQTLDGMLPSTHASFNVIPDKTGEYYIWLKVYAPNSVSWAGGDAVFCWIDGMNAEGEATDTYFWRQSLKKADGTYSQGATDFYWVRVYQRIDTTTQVGADRVYNWTAGETYTLRFRGYTAGVQIDEIYITNDPNDAPHNHSFSAAWEKDETYHWHKANCGHDELINGKAEHIYDNLKDTTCNDCGYVRPAHICSFSEQWAFNETQHWHQCVCGDKANVGNHSFVNGTCSVCHMLEPVKLTNGKGTLQGENAVIAAPGMENVTTNSTDAPAKVKANSAASAGATLYFNWTHTNYYALSLNRTLVNGTLTEVEGVFPNAHASFSVIPDQTGEYYIWLKVYAPNSVSWAGGDAVFCWIDGTNEEGKATDTYFWRQSLKKADGTYSQGATDFYWVRVYQRIDTTAQVGADRAYNWKAGEAYTLRFRGYTAGVQIDEIYITNDPNDAPHNHSFSAAWEKDETYHWHKANCGHDELINGKAEHIYDNLKDTTCNDCGYVRPAHICSFSEQWAFNETQHWHQCVCGDKANVGNHSFVNGTCSVCHMLEPVKLTNGKGTLQGENAVIAAPGMENVTTNSTDAPAKVKANSAASAGATLYFNWTHTNYYALSLNRTLVNGTLTEVEGVFPNAHASFSVIPDQTGEYYIWLKVYAPNSVSWAGGDAVFCWIDGMNAEGEATDTYFWRQSLKKADGTYSQGKTDFYWVRVYQRIDTTAQVGADRVYNWKAGEAYTLRFRGYTAGVQIDEIYITTDANDPYVQN